MTRSSNPVHEHILDFDDDFERELRRKRKNPEPSESSSSSESVSEIEEEVEDMAADNRTIKELSASGLDNAAPLCIQYPRAAPDKTAKFELKSSLLHHIPKYHGLSMEDPNNPRVSIKSRWHHHKPKHNLPKAMQVIQVIMIRFFNYLLL